ncbi:tRNA (adenosine(37)-N6)-threonylcarbamoyltransferase complex ATPase subunit type 1 TsaE [Ruegeria arenilitoris]|uniref:tRNA (adenosine(37)-N6)-threonylcarbamoyltransferase complex ATPase subunit type 1 TsaE n=1 Tax=Ruegeria arenilitoris TaxID=1173585 RepID=UPI00147DC754|nr:tRNA (adenosine(37)-N6)-threonylcarbamoyltransferase complex ATPase subunit type 1 TsaE [Ruegeria arenilitoris]
MNSPASITLTSPEETADLASRLSAHLAPGDVILLDGPIGSGKTHFARSLIQSALPVPEDVPSPTFTLVQVYDGEAGEIWHSDLYRLTSVDEIEELGLTGAFDTAICLVEWPDKLGPLQPASALLVQFYADPAAEETRHLTLTWSDPKWTEKLKRIA